MDKGRLNAAVTAADLSSLSPSSTSLRIWTIASSGNLDFFVLNACHEKLYFEMTRIFVDT